MSTSIESFAAELHGFDWFYGYSDDFNVWQAGLRVELELREVAGSNPDLLALWQFKRRQVAGVL